MSVSCFRVRSYEVCSDSQPGKGLLDVRELDFEVQGAVSLNCNVTPLLCTILGGIY